MKERGILFSGSMVRAILNGHKTQTRRLALFHPAFFCKGDEQNKELWVFSTRLNMWQRVSSQDGTASCPYGVPGDRLWVRETWGEDYTGAVAAGNPQQWCRTASVVYRADDHKMSDVGAGWKPSIHMPRWASRITLEIVSIRAERVQDITGEDAKAEGVDSLVHPEAEYFERAQQEAFARLWDYINAKRGYGWGTNPYVWVIEFKRI